jgi:hypothetical protein
MGRVREDRPQKEMVAGGVREHRVWDVSTCESARWARVEKLAGAVRAYLHGKDGTNVEVCGSEEDVRDVVGALNVPNVIATLKGKRKGNRLDVEVVVKEGVEVAKFAGSVEVVRVREVQCGNTELRGVDLGVSVLWADRNLDVRRARNGDLIKKAESAEERAALYGQTVWFHYGYDKGELQKVGEDVRG